MAIAAAEQLLDWTITEVAASLRVLTDQIARRVGASASRLKVPVSEARTCSASTCRAKWHAR